nr:DUF3575 domain-containing protein [Allomuricauda sp.]
MFKKYFLVLAFLFALSQMNAQDNIVKFNPLSLMIGVAELGYERVLDQNNSIQVDVGYTSFSSGGSSYSGFGVGGQYRFYVQESKNAPVGWFLAPVAHYYNASSNDFKTSIISVGGVGGYQWNWNPITLDIYGGPAYYSVNSDQDNFGFGFEGLGLRLGLSLGFAF